MAQVHQCFGTMFGLLAIMFISFAAGLEKPKDMPEDLYCLGCESTMKELDRYLSPKPTRGIGETVNRALQRVCVEENFMNHEVGKKTLLKVCKHIRGDQGLEAVLIREYGKKHELGIKNSYLDISKLVCGEVLKACKTLILGSADEEDGGIEYDAETQNFIMKPGKKVRVPNPVRLDTPEDVPTPPKQTEVKIDKELKKDTTDLPHIQKSQGHSHDEF